MTRLASALPLLALLAPAPVAAQAARDFQLPPAATPTSDDRVQGPVDPDAPVISRPRVIESSRPSRGPAPAASPTPLATAPAPAIVLPRASLPRTADPSLSVTPAQEPAPDGPQATGSAPATATPIGSIRPSPGSSPPLVPRLVKPPANAAPAPLPWFWIILGAGVALAGAALFWWQRRRSGAGPAEFLAPAVLGEPGDALVLSVEAMRLDRSVMNATLGYRVTLRNRGVTALTGLSVEADLVSATRERPTEQQLASPAQALTPLHTADRLAPGQSLRFEGQVRLPLSQASAIWQGRVGLLVPLLRMRATAAEAEPVATTLVIGQSDGAASRPQPFRLDEPPRSYAPLAQRVLDALPAQA